MRLCYFKIAHGFYYPIKIELRFEVFSEKLPQINKRKNYG